MKISSRPEDLFGVFDLLFVAALVKRGVDRVKVLAVKLFLSDSQGVSKALIVHDLTLAQVAQRVTYVGVIAKANEVVVGRARLLLCYCHVCATTLSVTRRYATFATSPRGRGFLCVQRSL